MQDFEKGVSDVQSRDVIEMMMITQYFDMLKVRPVCLLQLTCRSLDPVIYFCHSFSCACQLDKGSPFCKACGGHAVLCAGCRRQKLHNLH